MYKLNSLHLNPIRSKIDGHLFPVHNYYFAMQLCFIKAVFPIANADCRVRNRLNVDKMQTEPTLCKYIDQLHLYKCRTIVHKLVFTVLNLNN